jgi:hypothetical protein
MMDDLEHAVDRELKALPAPAAPSTLLPRVMAAVAQTDRAPWYSRAWLAWPVAAQAASVLALVAAGLAAWWVMPAAWTWAGGLTAVGAPLAAPIAVAADWAAACVAVGRAVWLVAQPIFFYFALIAAAASILAAAYWAALNRLALGGASLQ